MEIQILSEKFIDLKSKRRELAQYSVKSIVAYGKELNTLLINLIEAASKTDPSISLEMPKFYHLKKVLEEIKALEYEQKSKIESKIHDIIDELLLEFKTLEKLIFIVQKN